MTLSISGVTTPEHGSVVVNSDGTLTYTPAKDYWGGDSFEVTISNTKGQTDTSLVAVNTEQLNDPPQLTSPGSQNTPEGTIVSLQIQASDPNKDSLSFAATGLPAGLWIDAGSGLISGVIDYTAAPNSPYNVVIDVYDTEDLKASTSFSWTTPNTNQSPWIDNPGDQIDVEMAGVYLPVGGFDLDNDKLSYSASGLPPGLQIDSFGVIAGTIAPGAAGTYAVTVTVTDGLASVSRSFTWTVLPMGSVAPKIEIWINKSKDEDDDITMVNPDAPITALIKGPAGQTVELEATGVILDKTTVTLDGNGEALVTITPSGVSTVMNDALIVAKVNVNGQLVKAGSEDLTKVEVTLPANIRHPNTPEKMKDRIPPFGKVERPVLTTFNVQVKPDLKHSNQFVTLLVLGNSD